MDTALHSRTDNGTVLQKSQLTEIAPPRKTVLLKNANVQNDVRDKKLLIWAKTWSSAPEFISPLPKVILNLRKVKIGLAFGRGERMRMTFACTSILPWRQERCGWSGLVSAAKYKSTICCPGADLGKRKERTTAVRLASRGAFKHILLNTKSPGEF